MACWLKQLTSLALMFALSGTPAVLSACTALCLQATPMAAMADEQGALVGQVVPPSTAAAMPDHSHHGSPAAHAAPASADPPASAHEAYVWSDAPLGASCHDCCSDGVAVVALPGPRAERMGAALSAAATSTPVTRGLLTTSALGEAPYGAPESPPAATRAPLVLRI